ncbi:jacalin-related lectin 34-like [Pundamilia nyererei]|uniref:Jacalin-related lectin 34-like n=1 Tax=Pundamilia nyererei TaxID=303518 RepID=A0A9Y6M5W0_9CICH|nr:PREDICTED: jacalin-related lectin 34-like [Pundamilia nyererei]
MGDDGGNMGGLATWLVASLEGAGPHNGAHTAGTDQTGPTGSSSGAGIRCPGPLGSGQGSGLDHVVTSGSGSELGPDGTGEGTGWTLIAPTLGIGPGTGQIDKEAGELVAVMTA